MLVLCCMGLKASRLVSNALALWLIMPMISLPSDAHSTPIDMMPNIIIIFIDDMGYGDLGVYGGSNRTPNIDNLALAGIRFTDFYVSSPVCSASRAALLTGSYHSRVGIDGALSPHSGKGLSLAETTLAEILKDKGYSTALVGKWHLGDYPGSNPLDHGFDYYFGLPYSNDMSSQAKNNSVNYSKFPPLPLIRGRQVLELEPNQSGLTKRYTEEAISFIKNSAGLPFFLYLAHTFPHVPLYVPQPFRSGASQSLYGQVLAEIDWSVGRLVEVIEQLGLANSTLILLASDNGPWTAYGNHAGDCGPLRGSKSTVWECGIRVPFIAKWSGNIPSGIVSGNLVASIDIFPTVASIAEADSTHLDIDGLDLSKHLFGPNKYDSPREVLYFYHGKNELRAMRWGKWKLHFPHRYRHLVKPGADGIRGSHDYRHTKLALYDLESDIAESNNLAQAFPQVVQEMESMAAMQRKKLGDSLSGASGEERRAPAVFEYPWYKKLYWKIREIMIRMKSFFFGASGSQ